MWRPKVRWMFRGAALIVVVGLSACANPTDESSLYNGSSAAASGKSCQNKCGGASDDQSCYCDDQCDKMGDCCTDYAAACGSVGKGDNPSNPAGGGSSSGGAGNGGSGSSGSSGGSSSSGGAAESGGSGSTSGAGGTGGSVASSGASCAGYCGGLSADGTCYCDVDCQQYGDCCADVATACATAAGTGQGCAPALCNSENPGNEAGMECYCDSVCTQYGDCCSNKPQICGA